MGTNWFRLERKPSKGTSRTWVRFSASPSICFCGQVVKILACHARVGGSILPRGANNMEGSSMVRPSLENWQGVKPDRVRFSDLPPIAICSWTRASQHGWFGYLAPNTDIVVEAYVNCVKCKWRLHVGWMWANNTDSKKTFYGWIEFNTSNHPYFSTNHMAVSQEVL